MAPEICPTCNAPFFHDANIGANSISVKKACLCGAREVQPMPDVIETLAAIREFQTIPC